MSGGRSSPYSDFSSAWVDQLEKIRSMGEESSPRGQNTLERRWVQFGVADPMSFPVIARGREFRDVIGVLEALSIVGQFSVPELFTDRVAKFREFTDAGVFHGSYGARVAGRLGDLVDLLRRDPDTRQAVLSIYDSRSDLGALKRDIPCTLSLHFMRRGDELELRVTMRSNDIWLGTPYDFTQFAVLQASIAQALGLRPGDYIHSAGSLHLYERDFPRAAAIELAGSHEMSFPLWNCDPDIGAISSRARQIALGAWMGAKDMTPFERWASDLLQPHT